MPAKKKIAKKKTSKGMYMCKGCDYSGAKMEKCCGMMMKKK